MIIGNQFDSNDSKLIDFLNVYYVTSSPSLFWNNGFKMSLLFIYINIIYTVLFNTK